MKVKEVSVYTVQLLNNVTLYTDKNKCIYENSGNFLHKSLLQGREHQQAYYYLFFICVRLHIGKDNQIFRSKKMNENTSEIFNV